MRTRAILTSTFASVGVLIIGWQAGSAATTMAASHAATSTVNGPAGATLATANSGSNSNGATVDGTYTGDDVNTRYGNVQIEMVVSGGEITEVRALHLTDNDRKSERISNRAAPLLRNEALVAQSADVDNVSGATYTSNAYLRSLQSAIDRAGL